MTPPEMDEDDSMSMEPQMSAKAYIALWTAFVVGILMIAYVIVTIDTKDEQRIDAEKRYQELVNQPTPTVTVTLPPRTLPPKTVEVTIRVTERASRSSARSTVNRAKDDSSLRESRRNSASGFSGWKQRYWDEGQEWATWPKTRAVIQCESSNQVDAASGKYRGLYQIDPGKWASYGGLELAPRPDLASRAEQNYVAYRIYVGNGWTPWSCA